MLEGIAEMFADGYTNGAYEAACERAWHWVLLRQRENWRSSTRSVEQRRAAVARTKAWRRANPERFRALQRTQAKRDRARGVTWAQKYPEKERARRARRRDENREHMREVWRRNARAARARKATPQAQVAA